MSRRKWIKHRYPQEVLATQVCPFCKHFFKYVRVGKPRKYCEPCGRNHHLDRMRRLNAGYRRAAREKRA